MEQAISAYQVILFLTPIIPLVAGFFSIRSYIAQEREKFATKEYVKQEIKPIETKVEALSEKQNDQEDDLKYIRSRMDMLIDLHMEEKK
jgi:hypothetical protein